MIYILTEFKGSFDLSLKSHKTKEKILEKLPK